MITGDYYFMRYPYQEYDTREIAHKLASGKLLFLTYSKSNVIQEKLSQRHIKALKIKYRNKLKVYVEKINGASAYTIRLV